MSFAPLFLLVVAAVHFRLGTVEVIILLAGYGGFTALDNWYRDRSRRRKRAEVVEDELFGWKVSKNSEYEEKGDWSRARLTGENQIIAARVIQALARF